MLRVVPWLFALLFAIGAGYVGTRVNVTTDMAAFLPHGDDLRARLLLHELRSGVGGRLVLVGIEGAAPDTLADINRALAEKLRATPHFSFVNNGEGLTEVERSRLFAARYLLSPGVSAERFTTDALMLALQQQLDALASSAGVVTKQWLASDPTGEFLQVAQTWAGGGPVRRDGVFFNAGETRSLMLLLSQAAASDIDAQATALTALRTAFAAAATNTSAKLLVGGAPAFAVSAQASVRSDVVRLSLLATGLIVAFLLLALRSVRAVILSLLPLGFGVLAGICAVAIGFGDVHGITVAFGSTLIGVAVDYPLHFLGHLTRPWHTPYEHLRRIWPTLRLGALTTIIAFGALTLSSHTGLAQLGVFAVAGIAAAAATTRYLLPALIPRDFRLTIPPGFVHDFFAQLARTAPAAAKLAVLLTLIALVAVVVNRERLWAHELSALSPVPPALHQTDASLRADFSAHADGPLLLAVGSGTEAVLRATEQFLPQLDAAVAQATIAGYDTPARLLPSVATQQARQAALPARDDLRARLAQALGTLPFQPNAFAPFLTDVAAARVQAPLTPADFALAAPTGLLDTRIAASVFSLDGRWVAATRLRGVQTPATTAQLLAAAQTSTSAVAWVVVEPKRDATAAMDDYRDRALQLWAWGALGIVVTLVVGLGSLRRGLAVFVSPLAATVVTVAVFVLAGVALTLFHVIGFLLVMGLGIDYALYFDRLGQHADEWDTTFPALWKAWMTTVLGFSVLLWSHAPVLTALGLTVSVGITLCFLFAAMWARGRAPSA